jgi:cob(I)alamin adenosyltransferase
MSDIKQIQVSGEALSSLTGHIKTGGGSKRKTRKAVGLPVRAIENLENEIDRMTAMLPELKHFILPGGHSTVSHIHIARTVCRRTERTATALEELSTVNPIFIQYLNRLSDYLFTLSRAAAHELGAEENKWVPKK